MLINPEINRVGGIFDVGGVLAHDVWEGICFDPKRGLAAEHHLDTAQLARIGRELWQQFDTRPSRAECPRPAEIEVAYWRAFVDAVDQTFGTKLNPKDLFDLTDSFIIPVPEMIEVLARMREQDVPIALCSNNNVFWFSRQWAKCGLEKYLDAGRAILSCDEGVTKSHPEGLLFRKAIAVTGLDASALLYTDDRDENLEIAARYALRTACFNLGTPQQPQQVHEIRQFLLGSTERRPSLP